jgi:mRNA interferase RelE/StbE
MQIELSLKAKKQIEKLPKTVALRIAQKLMWSVDQDEPLFFAEPLQGTEEKLYRFRIGEYRVIFIIEAEVISVLFVLAIAHRKDIYRLSSFL